MLAGRQCASSVVVSGCPRSTSVRTGVSISSALLGGSHSLPSVMVDDIQGATSDCVDASITSLGSSQCITGRDSQLHRVLMLVVQPVSILVPAVSE